MQFIFRGVNKVSWNVEIFMSNIFEEILSWFKYNFVKSDVTESMLNS